MKKIFVFIGTRPEAIKLAPLVRTLKEKDTIFDVVLVSTGQHREMLLQSLDDFRLAPDISLDLMTANQSLAQLSAQIFQAVDTLLAKERPDMVLVQGDTTTVMVVALCAFYLGIPCGHVEAGLRSHERLAPFPEELNRRVATLAATLHFAPTQRAVLELQAEGVPTENIYLTGNTGIDALLQTAANLHSHPIRLPEAIEKALETYSRLILVTGHRRENFGEGLQHICDALESLAEMHNDVVFVYAVHLNPNVRDVVSQRLSGKTNILLTPPLGYCQFIAVMQQSFFVLTDSGGIQEEAPSLKKPVLVMRDVTERPEGIEAGCSRLVGAQTQTIVRAVDELLTQPESYAAMVAANNPYGDGKASQRIRVAIQAFFG